MPRAKKDSAAAGAAPGSEGVIPPAGDEPPVVDLKEIESYDLPKSIVHKLSKAACPPGVTMQKDVPIAMIKGSTVFVNYLAVLAHDTATARNNKTIQAAHVIDSIRELGWDDEGELTKMLKKELIAYRKDFAAKKGAKAAAPVAPAAPTTEGSKRSVGRPSAAAKAAAAAALAAAAQRPEDEEGGIAVEEELYNDEEDEEAEDEEMLEEEEGSEKEDAGLDEGDGARSDEE